MASERFTGKTAIVTGAASGIGAALTDTLVAGGARVLAVDINGDAFAERGARGDSVVDHLCDVTSTEQVEAMVEVALAQLGRIDLLFNNAGIGSLGQAPDIDNETWERVFAVNVHAILYACRAVIPHMRAQGGGAIVNTASISGLLADYGFGAYNASKGAVINYTRTLAIDHARDNIRVNALCPGFIGETGLTRDISSSPVGERWLRPIPMGRAGTAQEMAQVAAFLASDDASYMTGSIVVADGGLTAHTGQPDVMALLQARDGA